MKKNIEERTKMVALYILENKNTIRQTAKVFGLSKSTVHYDLKYRLQKIDPSLFGKVKKILDLNFSIKHIRGGISTKKKYMQK